MTQYRAIALLAIGFAVTACSPTRPDPPQGASEPGAHTAHAHGADRQPVLYESPGSYTYPITTTSPHAQRWFDQGLRFVYAFNHAEALKSGH
jgi:hypothetical protein